eukprot:Lithocolla_globosa_v1_NODE_8193_length_851_cov_54.625628.p1 type:complete len:179 gc:universal NODE_8193_length_851_cov_54.625628:714-178(-)
MLVSLVFAVLLVVVQSKFTEDDCPVCVNTINKILKDVPKGSGSDQMMIEATLRGYCKTAEGKERSLCYYIGGLEDSASSLMGEILKPLANSVPTEKVCERINKKDDAVCALRYPKDASAMTDEEKNNLNLKSKRVKELKKFAKDYGFNLDKLCPGCSDKGEIVDALERELGIVRKAEL